MDLTVLKYSGQGSFKVKKGMIDKHLFLLKTIGIYPWQVSMILWTSKTCNNDILKINKAGSLRFGHEGKD